MDRIAELEQKIKFYRHQYWDNNESLISDEEYDKLVAELKQLDPYNPILNEIESESNFQNKHKHQIPVLSLDKVYDYESLYKWLKKVARNQNERFSIYPKFDGINVVYYLEDGVLITRGDGESGENITNKINLIDFKYNKKSNKKIITGELIITNKEFEKVKDSYATPRHFVASVVTKKEEILNVKLTFIEHELIEKTFTYNEFNKDFWNIILEEIEIIKSKYPIDGIVISVSDKKYLQELGYTAHHWRGKIAYKFLSNIKTSVIKDIHFSSGKNKITPVAIIEPVEIENTIINRVTLHNAKMLVDNDIKIGDKIKLIKNTIPVVIDVIPGDNRKDYAKICPVCQSELVYEEPDYKCSNPECQGILAKRLLETAKTLEIDFLGKSKIEKFIDYFNCQTIIDILNLEVSQMSSLPGLDIISATNLKNNFKKVLSELPDYKLLASLNIPEIGINIAKNICKKYTLDELIEIRDPFVLSNIDGVGLRRAESLIDGIQENLEIIKEFKKIANIINTKFVSSTTNQIKICFSGTFDRRKSYYEEIATDAGFTVVDTVTKDLNYLVTMGAQTNKVKTAEKYGIPIISVQEFLKLCNK